MIGVKAPDASRHALSDRASATPFATASVTGSQ
jgi:hypothetical protein